MAVPEALRLDSKQPIISNNEARTESADKQDGALTDKKAGKPTTGQPSKPPKVTIKLVDWKTGLESALKKPFDNKSRAEIKTLLGQDVSAKGSEIDAAFHKALSIVLVVDKENKFAGPARLLIDSKYFKGNFRWGVDQATALHRAVQKDRMDVAEKLAKEYRNTINTCDGKNRTALHYAVRHGYAEMTRLLLHSGAAVNVFDDKHITPLHMLSLCSSTINYGDQILIAEQLLQNGAEINTKDKTGNSPLHDAAKRSHHRVIQVLIDYGADTECRNAEDETPIQVMPFVNNPEIRELFGKPTGSSNQSRSRTIDSIIPTNAPTCWGNKSSKGDSDDDSMSGKHIDVCWKFFAYIHFFYRLKSYVWTRSVTIHDLLHEDKTIADLQTTFVNLIQEKFPDEKAESKIRDNIWKWIHIPANQMSWVTDLVWRLTSDDNQLEPEQLVSEQPKTKPPVPKKRIEAWEFLTRNTSQRKGVNHRSYMRVPHAGDFLKTSDEISESYLQHSAISSNIHDSTTLESAQLHRREIWRNKTLFSGSEKISIVVPYIDFETKDYLNRDSIHTPRFKNRRDLQEQSVEYSDLSGLYLTQTLDQSYYDMLGKEEIEKRDRDQVVMKWFKDIIKRELEDKDKAQDNIVPFGDDERKDAESVQDENKTDEKESTIERLLMVNQLWLWKLDKDTVITAFPDRYHQCAEDTLLDTIRQGDIASFRTPEQLIENILFECATFLEEFWDAGLGIHVLDIFEISLARRSNDEVAYFRKFLDSSEANKRRLAQDITHEIKAIHEVKDIRDELHLILRIFESQRDVVKKFSGIFWSGEQSKYGKFFVEDCGIERLIERVQSLDNYAKQTVEGLDYLVQMKQAQSALDEAKTAGRLNSYIMLFTLVTIVFTPLSFMTSLFTIPFDYFPRDDSGITLSPDWTARRMATGEAITLAVVGLTGLGLYKFNDISDWYNKKREKNSDLATEVFDRRRRNSYSSFRSSMSDGSNPFRDHIQGEETDIERAEMPPRIASAWRARQRTEIV